MNSPQIKSWVESEIERGVTHVVMDLEACTGMDSTFMGTMAGLAMRLVKVPKGVLEVAGANEKNESSLDDLGLCELIDVNPSTALWVGKEDCVRESLIEIESLVNHDKAHHVLEAHKTLVDADKRNDEKFYAVIDCLESELRAKALSHKDQ